MTKVLIVDDHEANLYLLRAVLTGYGCEVTEARHGAAAMVKARVAPPELIVSDLHMPVMDGYTLLRQWKNDDQLKIIPFIVYTATYTEEADEKLALSMGADAFIVKPAEPEIFIARLRAVLAMARKGGLAPANEPTGDVEARLKNYNEVLIRKLEKKTIELEQANVEIIGREARLRTILDTEPECVKLLAADGSLLEINPAGLAMIEANEFSQVANQCIFPLIVPDHREEFRKLTAAAFAGESGMLEFEIVGLKGGHRWLETHAAPLRDATGKVTALLGITRDITKRKAALAELQRSEGRLRRIMESDMMGMIFWDTDGNITEANDSFLRIVGYTREDLQSGRVNWKRMTPPEYQAQDEEALLAIATRGACLPFEKEYFHQDGSRVPILIGGADLPEQPGHGVAFVIDVTDRRRAEEKGHAQLAELQRWHSATLGREDRVLALKREVNELLVRLGQVPRYASAEAPPGSKP